MIEGQQPVRCPIFKYLYDMNGQMVESILDHMQMHNSSTDMANSDNQIFQISSQKLSNRQLLKNNQILK